jgi:hypothetical protein
VKIKYLSLLAKQDQEKPLSSLNISGNKGMPDMGSLVVRNLGEWLQFLWLSVSHNKWASSSVASSGIPYVSRTVLLTKPSSSI